MESCVSEEQVQHEVMEDEPPEEMQDEAEESEAATEGETDVDFVAKSDHSSSSSSCSDLPTEDGEDANNPEKDWTSKSGRVWFPTNAETTRYVPSGRLTPGLTRYAIARIKNLVSSFDLFLTPEMIDIIVNMTNLNGRHAVPKWTDVDVTDVRAYIGLLILAGVYQSKGEPTHSLWDDQTGRVIFRATMSYSKFRLINSTLRFDDKKNRSALFSRDTLAPLRVIWDMWTQRLPLLFNPGKDVCVDEQLVPFRGRCAFRQYMPNNPARYGLKIWVAADVNTSYTWKCQIYTGKAADDTGKVTQEESVVLKLMEKLKGVTVTCDNAFTTYSLVQELLKRKVAMVGAIKKKNPELPPKLLQWKGRAVRSSVFAFTKTITAVSYIPKRGKDLILLSSKHRDNSVNMDDKKPVIITDYNRCKGCVDNLDQAISTFSCRKKTSRWPQALFFNMIDVSAFNSFVLFTAMDPKWNSGKTNKRRLFLEELGKTLVSAEMMRRVRLPSGPSAANMLQELQSTELAPITGLATKKRSLCWMCPNKRRKIDTCCIRCNKFTCKDHRVACCKSCWIDGTIVVSPPTSADTEKTTQGV